MSKEIRKIFYLGLIAAALWLGGVVGMVSAKSDSNEIQPPPVILTVPENVGRLVVLKLPFNHIGEIPNLGATKVNLIDNGAILGRDYIMSGVGFAHNVKTGDGIAVLEFMIIDDEQSENNEEFVIVLEFDDENKFGGSVKILDNDTI